MFLEPKESVFDLVERREVVRGEHLALDDGEIDLDLVEPAGMNGAMNGNYVVEGSVQTTHAGAATVGRAVVHHPEDTASGLGRLAQATADRWSRVEIPVGSDVQIRKPVQLRIIAPSGVYVHPIALER